MKRRGYVTFGARTQNTADVPSIDDDGSGDDGDSFPSDVEASISALRSRALVAAQTRTTPAPQSSIAPIILRDHLYTVIDDRSEVDREVEKLRCSNKIRLLTLSGTPGLAILHTADYCALLQSSSRMNPQSAHAFTAFEEALSSLTTPIVSFDALKKVLTPQQRPSKIARDRGRSVIGSTYFSSLGEEIISTMVRAGFLRSREMYEERVYFFAAPNLGPFTASLIGGRAELTAMIGRAPRREILRRELKKKILRRSDLGLDFHIMDLVAIGDCFELRTASGGLIRLLAHNINN